MTAQFIVSLALLITALAILVVALVKTIGAEDRSQRTYERPEQKYRVTAPCVYDWRQAAKMKRAAKTRQLRAGKQADQRVVQLADARRKGQ